MLLVATLLLSSNSVIEAPVEHWYGPSRIQFDLKTSGNPYDETTNDVEVTYRLGSRTEKRMAYFDGLHWVSRFLSHKQGTYTTSISLNGKRVAKGPKAIVAGPLKEPFVRGPEPYYMTGSQVVGAGTRPAGAPVQTKRFHLSNGQQYWPVGHSLGWTSTNPAVPITTELKMMGDSGVNWSRIWPTAWDDRNPVWPNRGEKMPVDSLNLDALNKWTAIVEAAQANHVHFQFCMEHHGLFATQVDPNWLGNPWNVANGGFLKDPVDFFTDAEALRLTKNYFRNIVARYADSPSILSWELFNEVENTDAARQNKWPQINAWETKMAAYLHKIDPYHHLITCSSAPEAWKIDAIDYAQPHGYPMDVYSMVLATPQQPNKPVFYGEVGTTGKQTAASEGVTIRDSIWGGVMASHQGSAQYWYWDSILRFHLYPVFKRSISVLNQSGLRETPYTTSFSPRVDTKDKGDYTLVPGIGWGPSKQTDFVLPAQVGSKYSGGLSSYIQGSGHAEMHSDHVKITFPAMKSGELSVRIGGASGNGAHLVAYFDGDSVKDVEMKPNEQGFTFQVPYTAGKHVLELRNAGSDWYTLGSIKIPGIAPIVRAEGVSYERVDLNSKYDVARKYGLYAIDGTDRFWSLIRLRTTDPSASATLSDLPLHDGIYKMKIWSLVGSGSKTGDIAIKHHSMRLSSMFPDAIMRLTR